MLTISLSQGELSILTTMSEPQQQDCLNHGIIFGAQIHSLPDAGGAWPDGLWAQLEAARQYQASSAAYLASSIWSATLWTA